MLMMKVAARPLPTRLGGGASAGRPAASIRSIRSIRSNWLRLKASETADEGADDAVVEPVDTVDTVETVETVKTVDGLDVDVDVDVEAPATLVGKARSFVEANPMAGYPLLGIAGFMGVTFVIAVVKTFAKSNFTSDGKRRKKINANKLVIDELQKYLPENRSALKGSAIAGIRLRTGFSPTEIFRKYLWYVLRELKFDHEAVSDLVYLRSALDLSDDDVAAALEERAKRVMAQFGTIMFDTSNMTDAGVERKASSRNFFSKLLYLVESEELWDNADNERFDLAKIFGCTQEDCDRLRIVSLYDIDLDKMMEGGGGQGEGGGEGGQ